MGDVLKFPGVADRTETDQFTDWVAQGIRAGWISEPVLVTGWNGSPGQAILTEVLYRVPQPGA
jgi:hypothetical protein